MSINYYAHRILGANIFHFHNSSYVFFFHNYSHSSKAITDCSVLLGVWQSFASQRNTERTVWLVGVLLVLKGGSLAVLEFEMEGHWPRISCKHKKFSDLWGWTHNEKLFFGTKDSGIRYMIRVKNHWRQNKQTKNSGIFIKNQSGPQNLILCL